MTLSLPSVTLLCVETRMHEQARRTLVDATSRIQFGDVLIYTNKPELIPVPGARHVIVPDWSVKTEAGTFCYMKSPALVTTDHMIFTEWDGGIRDVGMWDNAFLSYDYIGAPWPGRDKGGGWNPPNDMRVGNGGFTLWSKRLMDLVAKWPRPMFTDLHISKDNRRALEAQGMRWAPEEVAYRFSYECGTPEMAEKSSFGFHDIFNWPLALDREELLTRVRFLLGNHYITHRTPKLGLLDKAAPWLREALGQDYIDALGKYGRALPNYNSRTLQARRVAARRLFPRPTPGQRA